MHAQEPTYRIFLEIQVYFVGTLTPDELPKVLEAQI